MAMTEIRAASDDTGGSSAKMQYELGKKYEYGQGVKRDYQQAIYWYRQAAEQGHTEAQECLVFIFLNRGG
jgi:TPR repeat protein